ncbi:MAG: phosphatidate cytidylyltransferase [Lachnospira sp.]|nr:phosphatidate cytidylyltransferase [Lachnospira sp.]
MKKRIASGCVLGVLIVAALVFGGWFLFFFCLVCSAVGMFEFYRAVDMRRTSPAVIGFITLMVYYLSLLQDGLLLQTAVLCCGFLAQMMVYVVTFPKYRTEQISYAYFGLVWAGVMISYIYQTRNLPDGQYTAWLIFAGSWINDTCAYFSGKAFGKHKMTVRLSPHKTIEGAVGGIIGSGIASLVFGFIMHSLGMLDIPGQGMIFFMTGAIGAVFGIFGDLSASAIKRNHDIKDYGRIIPGHGGILDRFDSVIFTAPAVYYTFQLLVMLKG